MSYSDFDKFDSEIEKMFVHSNINPKGMRPVTRLEGKHAVNDMWLQLDKDPNDRVHSPAHYTRGKQEAIDIIEDAIQDAPTAVEGLLQAQVLKYILRLWLKDNSEEDAKKAKWYLERLIDKLS